MKVPRKPLSITPAMREEAAMRMAPHDSRRRRMLLRTALLDVVVDGRCAVMAAPKVQRRLRRSEVVNRATGMNRRQVLEVETQ